MTGLQTVRYTHSSWEHSSSNLLPPMTPQSIDAFTPPIRLLLGPGPSMVHPRVLKAMSAPLIGHLDPAFLEFMNTLQAMLRRLFRTTNRLTLPISGTGSAGMEALFVNLVEPGDQVIVGINGLFGTRMRTVIERCGGQPISVSAPWGHIIEPDAIRTALSQYGRVKAVALVHAETSTGAWQPLEEIGALCREHETLFLVDAVTSLAGLPVETDAWNIDGCYSGTQKCMSCPPGLSPITLNDRAMTVIRNRQSRCQSWYLDLSLVADYWTDSNRAYHHTAPISMLYALRESLHMIEEEGLVARWRRHQLQSRALMSGLKALGLLPHAQEGHRLPSLNCIKLPDHIEDAWVRNTLLHEFGIEIGGGLGELKEKVWRIGLMGESSTQAHVFTLLNALEDLFCRKGWRQESGVAVQAASHIYESGSTSV